MEVIEVASKDLLKIGYQYILNQKKGIAYSVTDSKFICVPRRGVVDEQLCYDMGYRVYELLYGGGVIVVEVGDFEIAHFGHTNNQFRCDFIQYFADWLNAQGINTEVANNDVLVDGYKVCGVGYRQHENIDLSLIHIGINTNLEAIKKICTKEMVKVPKGLGEYGITAEDIKAIFLEFCAGYNEYARMMDRMKI